MALETLKGVKKIGGFDVAHDPADNNNFGPDIVIFHDDNAIAFKIQNGPIKENGVNGCQVDTLIHAAQKILLGLDEKYPSLHNSLAIASLQGAIDHLADRTRDREARNVEGTSKA